MGSKELDTLVSLIEEYQTDPVAFVQDVIGVQPTKQQIALLGSISQPGARVSIRSGHGTGKTTSLAWAVLWFVSCFDDCKVPCTAPTSHQLFDLLWPEIATWHQKMNPVFKDQIEITADRIYIKGAKDFRFAVARTARKENPEALQGFHAPNLMFIIDEASGVAEQIFETAEGALSTKGSRVIMTSNPTRTDGYFHRSQNKERKFWTTLAFNCIDSPLVDEKYPLQMAERYGIDSAVYRVRVLGEFPETSDDTLIPLSWLEESVDRDIDSPLSDKIAGLDVARFGDDATALLIRQGGKILSIDKWYNLDTMATCGKVVEAYRKQLFDVIHVDVIGLGAGVADRLIELGIPCVPVNVAEATAYKEKFNRLRDELWWEARELFQDKGCSISSDIDLLDELIGELSIITYAFGSNGKIKVEGKAELKKRGVASPNLADSLCLTLYKGGKVYKRIKVRKFTKSPSVGWT